MGNRHPALLCVGVVVLVGCAGARVAEVSPDEIPALEARLAERPNDPSAVLRYAAALFAAGRCDSARVVALRGQQLRPADAVAPLVIGHCLEQAGEYDPAIATYREFAARYPDARGVAAVRAREMLALRARATAVARAAVAREAELAEQPGDPQIIAVLPLDVAGDTTYEPLSRGLAQMIISDLDLLQRFRLIERLQLGALLDELQLAQTARVDPATGARVGRLLRAGRMVQGLAVIPEEGEARLEANVVTADGQVTGAEAVTGRLRDLLRLEKDLVIGIAARLGYVLSEAERTLILENGTQNLAAFLAYSRGLVAEDLGDYQAAAQHFSQAVQADPGFQQARQQYQATVAATQVQQAAPTQVTTVAAAAPPPPPEAPPPEQQTTGAATTQSIADVSGQQGEQATQVLTQTTTGTGTTGDTGTNTNTGNPSGTNTTVGTTTSLTGTIRIVFRLP